MSPEVAQGKYANLVLISHSETDFVLDFAKVLPGLPKAMVNSRMILGPENAKRLLAALSQNIASYEQQYGVIGREPSPQGKTIAPFGVADNEA